ncbi:hypothetical protein CEXT_785581 [Caerostris extrusa]|uniref:Uncharacterized protein n=1 Tax=Caerostris extrusa TaxID=172846 RepID=A0AAV4MJZ1_CAEEX|nr:hypothetical protein CEXT_785581 [Caerostris extrusa]
MSLCTIFKAARQILPQSQRQREESAGNKTHPLRLNHCRAFFRGSQSPSESSRGSRGSNTYPPSPLPHCREILSEAQTMGRLWRKDLRRRSPAITSNAIMSHYWETHSLSPSIDPRQLTVLLPSPVSLSAGRGQRTAMGGCCFQKKERMKGDVRKEKKLELM